jgi:hypothetical protein
MTDETTQAPAQQPTGSVESPQPTNEPAWYIDDNTPGAGERPDWLPTNYKKVSDVAKSYSELEKKLGAFTGAPEEYNLGDLELDEDQLIVQEMKAVGKELNMSEAGLKKFLGRIASATETIENANLEDQIKKLGKDGERELKQFQNFTKDHLKPEEHEFVKGWVRTAEDLKMFNRLMANTTMSAVPTSQAMAMANSHETVAEVRKELMNPENLKKYETDRNYNSNYSKRLAQAVARENR